MTADFSPTGLRVLREVAQTGSFSAAARSLGYTQSAVSRQVAALEVVAGRRLVARGREGVTLTPAGARLLPRAVRIIDELDAAVREAAGAEAAAGPVRLGGVPPAPARGGPHGPGGPGAARRVRARPGRAGPAGAGRAGARADGDGARGHDAGADAQPARRHAR